MEQNKCTCTTPHSGRFVFDVKRGFISTSPPRTSAHLAGVGASFLAAPSDDASLSANVADSPMRNRSTFAAAPRPSEMAQTTSDCPRRQSPAAKTPGTDVSNSPNSALKLERSSTSNPSFSARFCSGPKNPIARRTKSAFHTFSLPGTSSKFIRPVAGSLLHSTPTVFTPPMRFPSSEGMNAFVSTSYVRGSFPSLTVASSWP
eukprot:18522-Pelagococcus_subviridis.AAC.10